MDHVSPDRFAVDTREAARLVGLSKSLLDKTRLYDRVNSPPFLRVGRKVLYPVNALRQWIEEKVSV